MAWVPIQDSGIAFTFSSAGGSASIAASVVSASASNLADFTINNITQPVTLRITAQSYAADSGGLGITTQAKFDWALVDTQSNTTLDGTGFTPSPIIMIITEADILGGGGGLNYTQAFGSEWAVLETYSFLVEVEVLVAQSCEELGRVTRAYVSGYNRSRVHQSILYAYEKRCLVANFNGAIPLSRTISEVQWKTQDNCVVVMSNAAISGREGRVTIAAQVSGTAIIRCTATLDNGERYTQMFQITVRPQPYYDGDTYTTGPHSLTATA